MSGRNRTEKRRGLEPHPADEARTDAGGSAETEAALSCDEAGQEGDEERRTSPELTASEVYFPREYARFVSRLARAVQRHSMYPPAHPALRPAVVEMREALLELLGDRYEVTMEVARNQVAIDGAESDPRNSQYRSLAALLHRHQLAAITFFTGVSESELAEFLSAVAHEPDRTGRPLADTAAEEGVEWSGIRLHAIRYGALGISRGEVEERQADPEAASRVWLSLARAAVGGDAEGLGGEGDVDGGDGAFDPERLAAAIEQRSTEQEFATDLVGKLSTLARELRGEGEDGELRGRASRFVSLISPETLRRVLVLGGDASARRGLVRNAAEWMEPESMVKLVRAAAGVERKDLSHMCLLLMMKLSRYAASDDPELSQQAEARLREQVNQLVGEWSVADTIPDQYGEALERMSASANAKVNEELSAQVVDPERMLQMSIELDKAGPRLAASVTTLLRLGRFSALFETLDDAPPENSTAEAVWESLERPETVGRILSAEEPDFEALDRVLARVGGEAVPLMLETLIGSESRSVRRHLFSRIPAMGPAAGPYILRRLEDSRWYVRRNMLALLLALDSWPAGWSPHEHARDPHPAVRREALKMLLQDRRQWDRAIRQLLEEEDPRSVALGLGAALEEAPLEVIPNLLGIMEDESLGEELRIMAVRALARLKAPETAAALLDLTEEPASWIGRLLGRRKLKPRTPVMLEALAGLARHWWHEPGVQRLLATARKSVDPAVREAAEGRRPT